METFSTRQTAVIAAANKTVAWLFRVTDTLFNTYYWSTGTQASSASETIVVSGYHLAPNTYANSEWERAHTFKIVNFSGITLRRSKSESGIHAPNDVSFTVVNSGNTLAASNFKGGTVRIALVINDGSGQEVCGSWRFRIKSASPYGQVIDVTCEDFLQEYLRGSYPNTRQVSDIFPNVFGTAPDSVCIPEPYGTCYVPLRSVYDAASDDRYYILGDTSNTYTIDEVRTPREIPGKSTWTSAGYSFTQSTVADADAVNWRMFQALISDGNPGIWRTGDRILDMPTKFRRSDTQGTAKNLFLYSEQFDNAAWINYGVTVTPNVTNAPDGTFTADRVSPTGGMSSYVTQAVTGVIGKTYTYSVHGKADAGELLYFEWHPATWTVSTQSVFNLASGTLVSGAAGDAIESLGDGWYRCSGSRVAAVTDISNAFFVDQYPNGDAGDSIFLWGAQLEEGENTHPYRVTTTASTHEYAANPADVIRTVLRNMGLLDYDLDLPSFDTAKATYGTWGLSWNFAFWYKEDRAKVLSRLLAMCHSCLIIGEQVKLQTLSKTSQATVDDSEVLKMQEVGPDTFRYTDAIAEKVSDSGYVAFQQAGEAQDQFIRLLVPAKTTTAVIDSEVITFPGVQDLQQAKKLGTLYYQRKFLKSADVSFTGKGTLLALRPDDVITISYADYGGTYDVLIDEVTINPDVSVGIGAIRFSEAFDDWADLSPAAVTVDSDTPTEVFAPLVTGSEGVTADELADNAATVMSGTTSTGSTILTTDYQNALSITITTQGGGVFLSACIYAIWMGGTGDGVRMTFFRDSTELLPWMTHWGDFGTGVYLMVDSPPAAGTYTYHLSLRLYSGSASYWVTTKTFVVMEMHR